MQIGKYSFGMGDRFGLQGKAQLRAIIKANQQGLALVPVWNKSNREHTTIHTEPADVRVEADICVKELGWKGQYFVDADHINLGNIERFIEPSNFFTIDVADYIGKEAPLSKIESFMKKFSKYSGMLNIPGIEKPLQVNDNDLRKIAAKFLFAVNQAGDIYRHIEQKKGKGNFVTEVSMDEVDEPQSPLELFFILAALSSEGVPAQTIAPKFTGRFNKGVDYEGDVKAFRREFEEDLMVIEKAVNEFNLPENLKLSVHSGSDKFTIYPIMGELIRKHDKGIHIKTAGTTWLEEMIGLAMAGDEALELAKSIYQKAWERQEELCKPYATVISIDPNKLPSPSEVSNWTGSEFEHALRHIPGHPAYNPHFRQLIHVGYKVAAEYSNYYLSMVGRNEELIGQQVYENLYERHIRRLFEI